MRKSYLKFRGRHMATLFIHTAPSEESDVRL
nr:MAG TPA: hypothetical protein [Caudoviricetes sp.]